MLAGEQPEFGVTGEELIESCRAQTSGDADAGEHLGCFVGGDLCFLCHRVDEGVAFGVDCPLVDGLAFGGEGFVEHGVECELFDREAAGEFGDLGLDCVGKEGLVGDQGDGALAWA